MSESTRYATDWLITKDEHRRLYRTNAWFRHGVDTLVRQLVPVFLEGLAVQAEAMNAEMEEARQRILNPLVTQGNTLSLEEGLR